MDYLLFCMYEVGLLVAGLIQCADSFIRCWRDLSRLLRAGNVRSGTQLSSVSEARPILSGASSLPVVIGVETFVSLRRAAAAVLIFD